MANTVEFCTSSACGVSSEHLNYKKASYGKVAISISSLLSREVGSQKATGSFTT